MLVRAQLHSWPPTLLRAQKNLAESLGYSCHIRGKRGTRMATYGAAEMPDAHQALLDQLESEYDSNPRAFRKSHR